MDEISLAMQAIVEAIDKDKSVTDEAKGAIILGVNVLAGALRDLHRATDALETIAQMKMREQGL